MFDLSLVDGLVATPQAADAASLAVVRNVPEGVAREFEGAAMDLVTDVTGEGGHATARAFRNVQVHLRGADQSVLHWTQWSATASFIDEQRVVGRCLLHAAERGWPVTMEFRGPAGVMDSWAPKETFGIPGDALTTERWLGEVAQWGWYIERMPDRVRLYHHEQAGGAANVVDEIADGFGELFGEKKQPHAGNAVTFDVGPGGLTLTVQHAHRPTTSVSLAANDIIALGAVPYGYNRVSNHADVTAYTRTDAIPMLLRLRDSNPIASRNAAVALKYALASVMCDPSLRGAQRL
jgi:hypothetical protein